MSHVAVDGIRATVSALKAGAVLALLLAELCSAQTGPAQASPAPAASTPSAKSAASTAPRPAAAGKPAGPPTSYRPNRFAGRAGLYYKTVWGIDSLSVKYAESGELVRFTWRVVDPERAKALNEKKAEPSLEDPQAGVSLVVPVMEKVGQLRQTAAPEVGRSYWVAFSNAGRRVKQGDRVNVVIGPFRADNLLVD